MFLTLEKSDITKSENETAFRHDHDCTLGKSQLADAGMYTLFHKSPISSSKVHFMERREKLMS